MKERREQQITERNEGRADERGTSTEANAVVKDAGKADRKQVQQKQAVVGKDKKLSIHERLEKMCIRDRLNQVYDAYTAKYGVIGSNANKRAFSDDASYCLLCSLEDLNEDGTLKRKADMFTKRTIKKAVAVTSVETCLLYTSRCV